MPVNVKLMHTINQDNSHTFCRNLEYCSNTTDIDVNCSHPYLSPGSFPSQCKAIWLPKQQGKLTKSTESQHFLSDGSLIHKVFQFLVEHLLAQYMSRSIVLQRKKQPYTVWIINMTGDMTSVVRSLGYSISCVKPSVLGFLRDTYNLGERHKRFCI